jgi:uncharacterized protein YqgV (UPF0045/DUF77 family)
MNIQVELSIYALGKSSQSPVIGKFIKILEENGLEIEIGRMSSIVTGDSSIVFPALQDAFDNTAQESDIILTAKFSNACPEK